MAKKKAATKKPAKAAKKSAAKKSAAKKSAAKKGAAKKGAAKKSAAAKKGAARKARGKKSAAQKRAPAKKAKATAKKKSAAKKSAAAKKGPAAKKAPAAKAATAAKKAPAAKVAAAAAPGKKVAKVADVAKVAKIGPKPTTTIVQHVFIQATPNDVFDALVQPSIAATVIGGECTGDAQVGGSFTHWNDYIQGKHLELVRGERIVQEWTTTEWPKGAPPSRLELQLVGTGGGTELTMTHSSVPSEQAEDYRQGWIDYYWTPMRAHFGG